MNGVPLASIMFDSDARNDHEGYLWQEYLAEKPQTAEIRSMCDTLTSLLLEFGMIEESLDYKWAPDYRLRDIVQDNEDTPNYVISRFQAALIHKLRVQVLDLAYAHFLEGLS